jgi:hypothetical protein
MARHHSSQALLLPLSLLAAAAIGCGQVDTGGTEATTATTVGSATTAPAQATTAPAAPAPNFTAADGRFSARFPTPPERAERSGGGITFVFYGTTVRNVDVFAGYADKPSAPTAPAEQVAFLRKETEEEGITQMTETTFLGRPAVDSVRRRVEDSVERFRHQRVFLVGKRVYYLTGHASTPAMPAEYSEMLASFRLT